MSESKSFIAIGIVVSYLQSVSLYHSLYEERSSL